MDLFTFLRPRGGAAKRSQLVAAGFQRAELEAAVAGGLLVRPLRGVYATTTADDGVLAAFRSNGRLTCISAAAYYNLWALHPAQALHLSCGNGVPKAGVVDHSSCTHPTHPSLPVAGLADVLLHALRCLPELDALVMVQCAAQRGDITAEFLRKKAAGEAERQGTRRAGSPDSQGGLTAGNIGAYAFCPCGPQLSHARGTARGRRSRLPRGRLAGGGTRRSVPF